MKTNYFFRRADTPRGIAATQTLSTDVLDALSELKSVGQRIEFDRRAMVEAEDEHGKYVCVTVDVASAPDWHRRNTVASTFASKGVVPTVLSPCQHEAAA